MGRIRLLEGVEFLNGAATNAAADIQDTEHSHPGKKSELAALAELLESIERDSLLNDLGMFERFGFSIFFDQVFGIVDGDDWPNKEKDVGQIQERLRQELQLLNKIRSRYIRALHKKRFVNKNKETFEHMVDFCLSVAQVSMKSRGHSH